MHADNIYLISLRIEHMTTVISFSWCFHKKLF